MNLLNMTLQGAVAEVRQLGLTPPGPVAAATALLQVVASALILSGVYRWLGALALAGFTLLATVLADGFWRVSGIEQQRLSIDFCEHVALAGGWLMLACYDLRGLGARSRMRPFAYAAPQPQGTL
ncbi:MAG TPA: DoxX family protein [Macromonas sp.]|nr:DoxX family protein [Macromonas sp.]